MKIAKLKTELKFQVEDSEPQKAEFEIVECKHERRGTRLPPSIRCVMDFYDRAVYEYCEDCKKITRVGKY